MPEAALEAAKLEHQQDHSFACFADGGLAVLLRVIHAPGAGSGHLPGGCLCDADDQQHPRCVPRCCHCPDGTLLQSSIAATLESLESEVCHETAALQASPCQDPTRCQVADRQIPAGAQAAVLCAEALLALLSQEASSGRVASLAHKHSAMLGPALAAVLHRHVAPMARLR